MSASGSEAEVGFRGRQGPLMTQLRHRPHIKGQLQLLPAIRIRVARWSGSPGRQRRNPRTVASTSGDAERSLQQIAEITSRLFGASTAADVNAAFGEANRRKSRRPHR